LRIFCLPGNAGSRKGVKKRIYSKTNSRYGRKLIPCKHIARTRPCRFSNTSTLCRQNARNPEIAVTPSRIPRIAAKAFVVIALPTSCWGFRRFAGLFRSSRKLPTRPLLPEIAQLPYPQSPQEVTAISEFAYAPILFNLP
jgi:hypothetical protein